MKPDERRDALNVVDANLCWLLLDRRMARAEDLLRNGELQAAVIRAQNPSSGPPPGDGNGSHSDPTADAALSGAATELRATEIRRCWLGELRDIRTTVAWLRTTIDATPAHDDLASTLRSLRWLTEIPHDRAARHHLEGEAAAEFDHAIAFVHARSVALRSGTLHTPAGKRVPSVHAVLESARRVTEALPPAPVQKPIGSCPNCAKYGVHADAPAGGYCAPCVRFRSIAKCLPRLLACREQDRKGIRARYTAAMVAEAKGDAKVRPGRSRAS